MNHIQLEKKEAYFIWSAFKLKYNNIINVIFSCKVHTAPKEPPLESGCTAGDWTSPPVTALEQRTRPVGV